MNDSLRVRGIQRIRDLEQAMNRVGSPWHFNTTVQGSCNSEQSEPSSSALPFCPPVLLLLAAKRRGIGPCFLTSFDLNPKPLRASGFFVFRERRNHEHHWRTA